MICPTCAKVKNVCQVCILDLAYNLPVQVRDTLAAESGSAPQALPEHGVNQSYFLQEAERRLANGETVYDGPGAPGSVALPAAGGAIAGPMPPAALTNGNGNGGGVRPGKAGTGGGGGVHCELVRMRRGGDKPYYKRNLAKICTFFLAGECNRGERCPFRHEYPKYKRDDPMAKQNIRDRYVEDPCLC